MQCVTATQSIIILANSIHSSMNSLETGNEYFTKPTSVGNKPGYIRTAAARHVVLLGAGAVVICLE